MMNTRRYLALCIFALTLAFNIGARAQETLLFDVAKSPETVISDLAALPKSENVPTSDALFFVMPPDKQQMVRFTCALQNPNQVQRYRVTCTDSTFLDVSVEDCCIPGDHFEAKTKVWDTRPNTAVTTSPDNLDPSAVATVYNYIAGGGDLTAEVDCSYLHGVNVFPAGATMVAAASPGGVCDVEEIGETDEINRTP